MADDNSVDIRFTASTDEALGGIAELRARLSGLGEPVKDLQGVLGQLKAAFNAATPEAMLTGAQQAFGELSNKAAGAALQIRDIGGEIALLHQGLAEQKAIYSAEAGQYQITQNQKFALLEAATQKEYEAELALLQQEAGLGGLSVKQQNDVLVKIAELKGKHSADMVRLDEQSVAAQQALWTGYLSTVTGAFNSQLRGLLEGTTSWHKATIKMLEDLTIKFIEMVEQMVVKWLAGELAQTTATTTGAAAREEAQTAAGQTSILATVANALKAIFASAGQTSAEVSAAVAPATGPAAPAVGAAAGAAVLSNAMAFALYDVGTDYVLQGGLAYVHPGEEIKPAKGTGPWTGSRESAGVDARTIGSLLGAHREAMGDMVSSVRKSLSSFEHEVRQLRRGFAGAR